MKLRKVISNFVKKNSSSPDVELEEDDDVISKCIGEYGRWQFKHTFILALFTFAFTFSFYSITFTGAERKFWCSRPPHFSKLSVDEWRNISHSSDNCRILNLNWNSTSISELQNSTISYDDSQYVPCTSWEFDTGSLRSTVISEWSLVCDQSDTATNIDVVYLVGVAVGALVSGYLSDRYGRKITLISTLFCQSAAGILMIISTWIELFLFLKFVAGFCVVSVLNSAFILAMEIVGGKWRTIVGIANFIPMPISYVLVSVITMFLPDWKYLQLTVIVPFLPLLLVWWVLPESPVWLFEMGRIDELKQVLRKAAKENNTPLPEDLDKVIAESERTNNKSTVMDLFRDKMYITTLNSFFGWFACNTTYFGFVLKTSSLGGDIFLTSILSGIVEIPAIIISIPIALRVGRRYPATIAMVIAGVCYIVSAFFEDQYAVRITILLIGKFAAGLMNGIFPILTAELFPPLIRNLAMGSNQFATGIALVCVPFIWLTSSYWPQLPMILLGIIALAGSLSTYQLYKKDHNMSNSNQVKDKSMGSETRIPHETFVTPC